MDTHRSDRADCDIAQLFGAENSRWTLMSPYRIAVAWIARTKGIESAMKLTMIDRETIELWLKRSGF